ncbi:MAG: serine/threonine-protein phosphatase [Eubacteriaceae bacterium]|nr:serine/threonine-protein phosphatase [Eubacteriaceae bacterium]
MSVFFDVSYDSINKFSEELCGDHVEISKGDDYVIVVLADGLGSGVKANILATLTSNIAATMLRKGSTIDEVVDTLTHTLPVCKKRGLAYSTFTIIQVFNRGDAYIVEFDNPQLLHIRNNRITPFERKEIVFADRTIYEGRIKVAIGDSLVAFTDGVVHAGIGEVLNLGWGYHDVCNFLEAYCSYNTSAKAITKHLLGACNDLYCDRPGDDTTVLTVKIVEPQYINLFTGPPKEKYKDKIICDLLFQNRGKKVVCGGSAANIIARETGKEIHTDLSTLSKKVPPIGQIQGLDLVTEGVLTLSETIAIITSYNRGLYNEKSLQENNGASMLAELLINQCTHLTIIMGNAINPAHQNPNFPEDLSLKWKLIQQLIDLMKDMGKEVETVFI